jgi:hypothetical protein
MELTFEEECLFCCLIPGSPLSIKGNTNHLSLTNPCTIDRFKRSCALALALHEGESQIDKEN